MIVPSLGLDSYSTLEKVLLLCLREMPGVCVEKEGESYAKDEKMYLTRNTDSCRPCSTPSPVRRTPQKTESTFPQTPQQNIVKETRIDSIKSKGCSTGSYKRRQKRMLKSNIDFDKGTIPSWRNRCQTAPSNFKRSHNFRRHLKSLQSPLLKEDGKLKSRESWIPEEIRQKMVKRDLAVAMENYESNETCLQSSLKDQKHRNVDSLSRSLCKEKFGIEQRKDCGLCCARFLPVNLVLAVPLKAVLDIRDSWGDKYDPEGSHRVRVNPNLRKAPACYNSTRVCAFCAQLFDQQQETYRPSWEAKEAERERQREIEEAAHWKVVNDPLSQIEKEREEEVSVLQVFAHTGIDPDDRIGRSPLMKKMKRNSIKYQSPQKLLSTQSFPSKI